jgi:hypothetical protein
MADSHSKSDGAQPMQSFLDTRQPRGSNIAASDHSAFFQKLPSEYDSRVFHFSHQTDDGCRIISKECHLNRPVELTNALQLSPHPTLEFCTA